MNIKFHQTTEGTLLVRHCCVQSVSSTEKRKHSPFSRILRGRFSRKSEEQAPRVMGADHLAVLGAGRENSCNVTSLEAGVFEQLSHTFCDATCGV